MQNFLFSVAVSCLFVSSVQHYQTRPASMIALPGGKFYTTDPQTGEPLSQDIAPFQLDRDLVTVAQFMTFAEQTGYRTDAEWFGNSTIFDFTLGEWRLQAGADFRHPFGPDAAQAIPSHPVTQVSWYDAVAYARWCGKRLPTDAEWEWAARNANTTATQYPWGNDLTASGQYRANTWQGSFPVHNTRDDGFLTTSPAGYFGPTPLGLTDMGGNVWQWVQDAVQPTGCNADLDLRVRRVARGGSFLCDLTICHGFRIGNRTNSTPETGMVHTGFRCAQSISARSNR